jgi:hypothetical protein
MPTSAQVTVTTTATLLVDSSIFNQTVWIHNSGGVLYIGASNVTTANGYKLDNDDKMQLPVGDYEGLYGIVASGTTTVFVLKQVN